MISYTVRCTFENRNQELADRWLEWLSAKHIAEVKEGGAVAASVFEMQAEDLTYEIRYEFETLETFEVYQRDFAPALKKDGLETFPLELGLAYSRSVGRLVPSG